MDTPQHSLDHPLITMISYVGNQVEDELDDNLNSMGLSVAQLSTLDHIHQNTDLLALSELAQQKGCVKSNITQLIDRMESSGLVKRIRSEKDRRKVLVVLTSKGKQLHRKGMKLLKSTENEILSRLSDQQRKHLAHLLDLIGKE